MNMTAHIFHFELEGNVSECLCDEGKPSYVAVTLEYRITFINSWDFFPPEQKTRIILTRVPEFLGLKAIPLSAARSNQLCQQSIELGQTKSLQ
jgi:hypothetical protein